MIPAFSFILLMNNIAEVFYVLWFFFGILSPTFLHCESYPTSTVLIRIPLSQCYMIQILFRFDSNVVLNSSDSLLQFDSNFWTLSILTRFDSNFFHIFIRIIWIVNRFESNFHSVIWFESNSDSIRMLFITFRILTRFDSNFRT